MRATIYSRVSDDDKRERRSVGEQEQDSLQRCGELGWDVVETFRDNDRSASRYATKTRPGYENMLDYLRAGTCDVLVLWESSRGDRELERWAGLLNLCRRLSISIHIVTHGRTYNLDHSRDWRTLAEDGVDSAYESEKTRERVMRAVRKNASAGRPHGKLLYGYTRTYDERGNFVSQDINEDQAAVIREAARRVADGEACHAIAKDYNVRGIPAPRGGRWDLIQIRRVVSNPAYIGKRVHQGQIVGDAVWDGILDEKTYWACHAVVNEPDRNTVRDGAIKHLLSGIAKCGVCEAPVKVLKNRGVLSYQCSAAFHTSIGVTALETYVVAYVRERMFRLDTSEIEDEDADELRSGARKELKKLTERLDSFTTQAAMGKLSAKRLGIVESQLEPQIEDARRRARSGHGKRIAYKVVDNPELWEALTIPQRRDVIRDLVTIHVDTIGRGRRNYNISERVRIS